MIFKNIQIKNDLAIKTFTFNRIQKISNFCIRLSLESLDENVFLGDVSHNNQNSSETQKNTAKTRIGLDKL